MSDVARTQPEQTGRTRGRPVASPGTLLCVLFVLALVPAVAIAGPASPASMFSSETQLPVRPYPPRAAKQSSAEECGSRVMRSAALRRDFLAARSSGAAFMGTDGLSPRAEESGSSLRVLVREALLSLPPPGV